MTVLRDAEVKLRNNSIFYYCFKYETTMMIERFEKCLLSDLIKQD